MSWLTIVPVVAPAIWVLWAFSRDRVQPAPSAAHPIDHERWCDWLGPDVIENECSCDLMQRQIAWDANHRRVDASPLPIVRVIPLRARSRR